MSQEGAGSMINLMSQNLLFSPHFPGVQYYHETKSNPDERTFTECTFSPLRTPLRKWGLLITWGMDLIRSCRRPFFGQHAD